MRPREVSLRSQSSSSTRALLRARPGSLAAGECGAGSVREQPGQPSSAPASRLQEPVPAATCSGLPSACSPGWALGVSWLLAMHSFGMIRVRGVGFPWLDGARCLHKCSILKNEITGNWPLSQYWISPTNAPTVKLSAPVLLPTSKKYSYNIHYLPIREPKLYTFLTLSIEIINGIKTNSSIVTQVVKMLDYVPKECIEKSVFY